MRLSQKIDQSRKPFSSGGQWGDNNQEVDRLTLGRSSQPSYVVVLSASRNYLQQIQNMQQEPQRAVEIPQHGLPNLRYFTTQIFHSRGVPPRVTLCREAGHTIPAKGWLKKYPKESRRNDEGHSTPAMAWLKQLRNDSCWREAGHTTPTIGWLK